MTRKTTININARRIGRWEPGTPEWLTARRGSLTGSDAASILGDSPYSSPYALWCQKTGRTPEKEISGSFIEWGHRLEPVVAAKWLETHPGYQFAHGRYQGVTWAHSDWAWWIANPDRLVISPEGELEILEIKTSPYGTPWVDGMPAHYYAQLAWYLDTLRLMKGHMAVLISGHDYREYEIGFDSEYSTRLYEAAVTFREHVATGTPPPLDESPQTLTAVRESHPNIDLGTTVTVNPFTAVGYEACRRKVADAESQLNLETARLLTEMGDAEKAVDETGTVIATRRARRKKDGTWGTPYLQAAQKKGTKQ